MVGDGSDNKAVPTPSVGKHGPALAKPSVESQSQCIFSTMKKIPKKTKREPVPRLPANPSLEWPERGPRDKTKLLCCEVL